MPKGTINMKSNMVTRPTNTKSKKTYSMKAMIKLPISTNRLVEIIFLISISFLSFMNNNNVQYMKARDNTMQIRV